MVTLIRSAVVAPGKTGEAIAFANQIAKLVKEKYGTAIDLLIPVGGNPSRIAWLWRHDSLAHWETLSAKLLADKEYLAAIASNAATFLPGSVHDEIWRTI